MTQGLVFMCAQVRLHSHTCLYVHRPVWRGLSVQSALSVGVVCTHKVVCSGVWLFVCICIYVWVWCTQVWPGSLGSGLGAALWAHACAAVRVVHGAFARAHWLKILLPKAPTQPNLCPLLLAATFGSKRRCLSEQLAGGRIAQQWDGVHTGPGESAQLKDLAFGVGRDRVKC